MIEWWGPILTEYDVRKEANGGMIINSPEWLAHRRSVGRAVLGELRILDDATGAGLPAREIGEVYFAGGRRSAYHNDPAKTAAAHDAHAWSTLGDVGFLDEDGYFTLTDRKAYRIISGGVSIYTQETEDFLIGHPDVLDVAVFGMPDAEIGEQVMAVVRPAGRHGADRGGIGGAADRIPQRRAVAA